jgi:hypothetical protein
MKEGRKDGGSEEGMYVKNLHYVRPTPPLKMTYIYFSLNTYKICKYVNIVPVSRRGDVDWRCSSVVKSTCCMLRALELIPGPPHSPIRNLEAKA